MCAKVNKKASRTVDVPPLPATPNRTPQRNNRKTPSKAQAKGKTAKQQNRSTRSSGNQSETESDDDENNSDSSTDYLEIQQSHDDQDDELDYIGRPPTNEPSDSVRDNDDESESQEPSRSTRVSRSFTNPRPSRKQTKPKKRKDRVTKTIINLQSSTKLLIPRLPFQRTRKPVALYLQSVKKLEYARTALHTDCECNTPSVQCIQFCLVREVLQQFKHDFRMQSSSLACLQEASEYYMVQLFEDSQLCCLHRQRQTVSEKDIKLVQLLRGPSDVGRR